MLKAMRNPWVAPGAAFVFALILYSLNLDRPPHPDELHHVIAAQNLLETGRPIIAEGEYWRGILHTWLVAISYAIFGEGLASARIPSVIAVALVVAILHVWVRNEAGSRAAWFTTVLFATSPYTVEIAQFCRFYALQLLFFTSGSIAVFYYDSWRGQSMAEGIARSIVSRSFGFGDLASGDKSDRNPGNRRLGGRCIAPEGVTANRAAESLPLRPAGDGRNRISTRRVRSEPF